VQLEPQVTTSQSSHPLLALVAPGLHTPSPLQAVKAAHSQVAPQVRFLSPQLPHAAVSTWPGVQVPSPLHEGAPQVPADEHTRVLSPHLPHAPTTWSVPGTHALGSAVGPPAVEPPALVSAPPALVSAPPALVFEPPAPVSKPPAPPV